MPESRGSTLLILAAGVGRRFGGLKQLESVGPGGEALLEYSIFDALRAGFNRIVLVVRPEIETEVRRALDERVGRQVTLTYAHQRLDDLPPPLEPPLNRVKPWGTGHAVLAAESAIQGPFAVVNADDFYGAGAFSALVAFLRALPDGHPSTFALAGFNVSHTLSESGPVTRGLCRADVHGWLEKIAEVTMLEKDSRGARYRDSNGADTPVSANSLVSMNMWGFTPAVFPQLRNRFRRFLDSEIDSHTEFLLPDVVQAMIADGSARVRVIRHDGVWCGITFPEDREPVRRFIADLVACGNYPTPLWR